MKAKKLLAFLMVSTLLVSMFAVSVSASGITNRNNNDWYRFDVLADYGPEKTAQIVGVRFLIANAELNEDEEISGSFAFSYRSNSWDSVDFSNIHDPAVHRANVTMEYVERRQRNPFFSVEDTLPANEPGDEWVAVYLALWNGTAEVVGYEVYDADGNVIAPGAAAAPAPVEAAPEEAAPAADGEAAPAAPAPVAARTGDSSMVLLFSLMFIVGAVGFVVLRATRKQKSQ
jgi:hypothetical protein